MENYENFSSRNEVTEGGDVVEVTNPNGLTLNIQITA